MKKNPTVITVIRAINMVNYYRVVHLNWRNTAILDPSYCRGLFFLINFPFKSIYLLSKGHALNYISLSLYILWKKGRTEEKELNFSTWFALQWNLLNKPALFDIETSLERESSHGIEDNCLFDEVNGDLKKMFWFHQHLLSVMH